MIKIPAALPIDGFWKSKLVFICISTCKTSKWYILTNHKKVKKQNKTMPEKMFFVSDLSNKVKALKGIWIK